MTSWDVIYTPEPEAHHLWIDDNAEPDYDFWWTEQEHYEAEARFYETHELCYD